MPSINYGPSLQSRSRHNIQSKGGLVLNIQGVEPSARLISCLDLGMSELYRSRFDSGSVHERLVAKATDLVQKSCRLPIGQVELRRKYMEIDWLGHK